MILSIRDGKLNQTYSAINTTKNSFSAFAVYNAPTLNKLKEAKCLYRKLDSMFCYSKRIKFLHNENGLYHITGNAKCNLLSLGRWIREDRQNKNRMRTSENDLSWQFICCSFQWRETKNAAHSHGQFHKLRFNIMLRAIMSVNSVY